jgi:hypothetical protein
MLFVGSNGAGAFQMQSISLAAGSDYSVTDLSSSFSGCTGLNVDYPGLVYYPARDSFVGYPNSGNTVYEIRLDQGKCIAHTFAGGPPAASSAGTFGRFQYSPALGKFIVTLSTSANAYTLALDATPTNGLGATAALTSPATRYQCVDRDGDGYGAGEGCLGRDADDLDVAVYTSSHALTKWTNLAGVLAHRGYSPTRIWYIATDGDDGTCKSGGAPVGIGSPCLTATPVLTSLAAGDMVIYRAGTYTAAAQQFLPVTDGTSGSPIIVMAYPGEAVTINTSINSNPAIDLVDRSWYIIDGLRLTKGYNSGCLNGGPGAWFGSTFHDVTVRNMELVDCKWGFIASGSLRLTFEDSTTHDHPYEHGIYFGARGNMTQGIIVRRAIAYNNAQNGFKWNNNIADSVIEHTIAYSNGIANYDWQNGVHNSFHRNNLSFQGGSSGTFNIYLYPGTEGTGGCGPAQNQACTCAPANDYSICAHDQTGNVIENFTAYQGQYDKDGAAANPDGIYVNRSPLCDGTTPACMAASMGSNTYRNVVVVVNSTLGATYPPIWFKDAATGWPESSTFDSIVGYQSDPAHRAHILRYGNSVYGCASPPAGVTLTNCTNADPQFVAVDPGWYNNIAAFDFRLQSGAPGVGAAAASPIFDIIGNPRSGSTPSIGAYEYQGAVAATELRFSGTFRGMR